MAYAVIDNPILNSPFAEPQRHWKFTDTGITDEVVEGRLRRPRVAGHLVGERGDHARAV
jgi:hypothetical protein